MTVWGKIAITIRKSDKIPTEQIYYDEQGEKKRIMTFADLKTWEGRTVPSKMVIETLGKGSKTTLIYQDLKFDPKLPDQLFSVGQLKRQQ